MGSGFIYNREMLGVWCRSLTPCHKSWCQPEPNSPRAGLTGLVLWEVETRNPGVMSMGALGQLWETEEKAEVRVFRGVDPWWSGGGGPVKHGHFATHPGQCAMMGVPFSECMHLTRTHTACIYQSKISGSGWREGAARGFFGGEVCNPEGKGLERECFQVPQGWSLTLGSPWLQGKGENPWILWAVQNLQRGAGVMNVKTSSVGNTGNYGDEDLGA